MGKRKKSKQKPRAAVAVAVVLAVAAALAVYVLAPAPSSVETWREMAAGHRLDRLNVVLVTIDTLRADHLSCYGTPQGLDGRGAELAVETPHIDALAAEGVRFANAATTVPFTLPAHSSIMTGTYPPRHGVRENVGYFLDDSVPTLAEHFRAAGYQTAGFVSAFVLDARWGIDRGFDHYFDDFDVTNLRQVNMGSVQRDGDETIATALDWLDSRDTQNTPFFLWLHLFDPHEPYTPPEPYKSRYPKHPYGAEVAYTDELIGGFRRALEDRGVWDDSLVVLTGDHGEGLGDHGESFHGYFVYDSTVHVPLIVRLPLSDVAGRVVDDAVSHVDLKPTLLELTGQAVPGTAQGQSLLPLLLGHDEEGEDERIVYSESYYALLHYGWSPLKALRSTSLKYIDAPQPELYDLAADAGEAANLFGARRRTAGELSARLQALLAIIEPSPEETREESKPDLDEETLRQLQALGYVAGRGEIAEDDNVFPPLGSPQGDNAVRADPKDKIQIHQSIMWAQSFIGQERHDEAEARLLDALAEDPDMIDAHQMLGNIAVRREDFAAAAGHFQRALERYPEHQASLFGLANSYRRMDQLDEALIGFKRLHALSPHDSKAAIAMTEIYVQQERLELALEAIDEAVKPEEAPPRLFNQHGEILALLGRKDEAAERFHLTIAKNNELAQPFFNLAVLAEGEGKIDDAIELYDAAIERAPAHFQAQFNLARLYGARGDMDRQQELFEAAIESNPDFVRGYYFLAKLLMDRGGDLRRAEELARQGIELDPEHRAGPFGYFVWADILNRLGRRSEAMKAVTKGRRIRAESS